MDVDRRLDTYAARQHGVVNRAQALAAGLSDTMIQRRLSSGRWVRLAAGIYAYASAPPNWERQVAAAVLSRPLAIVAGRSAASMHGFDGVTRSKPEILVPGNSNGRSSLARLIRDRHFGAVSTTRVANFNVTSIAETIWSLTPRLSEERLERMVDNQLAAGRLNVDAFDPILERIEGERRPGGPRLRAVLSDRRLDAYQPATTELEALLYPLLDRPGIPASSRQCPIRLDEGIDAVLDAFIGLWGMIVEVDGRRWHTRRADFERDRRRDNAALAMGLIVIRFTYRMLIDEPDYCLRTLLNAGRNRAPGI